jgi:hypothetical protein
MEKKQYRTQYLTLGSFIKEIFKDAPHYSKIDYVKQWIDIYYITGQAEQDEADEGKNTYIKPLYMDIKESQEIKRIYKKELDEILGNHGVDSLRVPEKLQTIEGLNILRIKKWWIGKGPHGEQIFTKRTQTQDFPEPKVAEILNAKYGNSEY